MLSNVTANERFVQRARRMAHETVGRIGTEIHDARVARGLSQAAVAAQARTSRSKVGRIERGEFSSVPLPDLISLAAVVGLELSVRAYPVGSPLRDRSHATLLERFRQLLHPALKWATEVPLPNAGDLRAWDALVRGFGFRIGIEAETRVRDGHELERRVRAKQRDGGVDVVLLVLADTRSNRQFLRERAASFDSLFPVDSKAALAAMARGERPTGNALVMI